MSPSTPPPPTKDCRNCNRRRIRCDRGIPTCVKCHAKGLTCPGYGLHLRWANSTGRNARPKARSKPSSRSDATVPPLLSNDHESGLSASPLSQTSSPVGSSEAVLETLPDSVRQRLLNHYAAHIAPRMVWVDSDRNEYKRLVVPLAGAQMVLRHAIMATAAAHSCDQEIDRSAVSSAACKDAQQRITQRVRRMIQSDLDSDDSVPNPDDTEDTNEAVLASALILSNHSLLTSQLSEAQIHRRAVRVLINSILFSGPSDGQLFSFLRNQAAIFDVFTCTTIVIDSDHVEGAVLPGGEQDSVLFGNFLVVVQDITLESIHRHIGNQPSPATDVGDFEDRFELARASTLAVAAALGVSCQDTMNIDLVRLVDIYHHAGVLYAFKRLKNETSNPEEDYHIRRLFRVIQNLDDLNGALHNLAWPIFIAGLCSWPNIERIHTVQQISGLISEKTGFCHYKSISDFHRELWDSPHHNWLLLAREWETRHLPLIPV
ncbi:hypothetical protein PV08_07392 [Exophiala spinifera]|uniref:Zn(2)-C6 fungal-type domain-containing protein n=1 Tax=Exophiala spinifera TaxID=91928 RepID=A0A0D2B6T6_9EURO|nr:uncharacterized protein PV08_07392 [Exophiala spinifera]KIW14608.1 hypothetical protein PV08_07392 [Exophiala spinifera]